LARTRKKTAEPAGHRRELIGLALLLLALLFALSLIPVQALGPRGAELFPHQNVVGRLGGVLATGAWSLFGLVHLLLPVFPAIWGLHAFGRIDRPGAVRLSVLLGGVVLILPAVLMVLARPLGRGAPEMAGVLGVILGHPLAEVLGWVGAFLLLVFVFAALCVATIGWNPIRPAVRGGRAGWAALVARVRTLRARPAPVTAAAVASGGEVGAVAEPEPDAEPESAEPPSAPPRGRRGKATDVVGDDAGLPESEDIPGTDLLTPPPPGDDARSRKELDDLGRVLEEKLATFRIQGEVVGRTTGPVVTQFEVEPAPGVKVARIANLDADLALALRAPSVRIVAPIPGKGAVGVEVPNPAPSMVYFREVIEAPAFRSSRAQLPLALGKDIAGQPYVADLARMPHLLIAGATGSGKSVCINTIITSLIYRYPPRGLRLLMVDPKMVELSMYNRLPHLRHPVVTDNQEAAGVLRWAVLEMERRYGLLSANGVRNLQDFNRRLEEGQEMVDPRSRNEAGEMYPYEGGLLPYIVLVIDELADLMMTVQGEVEKPLALLAQKARAIGIHLILATQRPSVNVITGLIKANFPSRIAFRVSSKVDSRTILDQNGADNLLGNGDMLFLPPGQSDPVRVQGAFLSTEETERLMEWYAARAAEQDDLPAEDEEDILEAVMAADAEDGKSVAEEAMEDRDELFRDAAEVCIQNQAGSTSLLQRRMRIGYGRAARIIDQLHYAGVLGAQDGSKPREVLVDMVQLEEICRDG
jgi:DNA segregation ATPase FtsK/SpoIIIE, S-DNA-T family